MAALPRGGLGQDRETSPATSARSGEATTTTSGGRLRALLAVRRPVLRRGLPATRRTSRLRALLAVRRPAGLEAGPEARRTRVRRAVRDGGEAELGACRWGAGTARSAASDERSTMRVRVARAAVDIGPRDVCAERLPEAVAKRGARRGGVIFEQRERTQQGGDLADAVPCGGCEDDEHVFAHVNRRTGRNRCPRTHRGGTAVRRRPRGCAETRPDSGATAAEHPPSGPQHRTCKICCTAGRRSRSGYRVRTDPKRGTLLRCGRRARGGGAANRRSRRRPLVATGSSERQRPDHETSS